MPANPLATPSLILAALVLASAGFLAWRQAVDRRRRADDRFLTKGEAAFFARQDVRRRRGTILMALAGLAIGVTAWVNPRAGPDEARFVFSLWILVGGLLLVMVALAFWDSLSTLAYARHQRRAILRERLEFLEDTRRIVPKPENAPDRPGPDTETSFPMS